MMISAPHGYITDNYVWCDWGGTVALVAIFPMKSHDGPNKSPREGRYCSDCRSLLSVDYAQNSTTS